MMKLSQVQNYPKVGIFWNLWEAAVPPLVPVCNIFYSLKMYASAFGVLKQFLVVSDIANAVHSRYYTTKLEFKQLGIPLIEVSTSNNNQKPISDRSEIVSKIWEFIYDNYELSTNNGIHIILIDRKGQEYSLLKSLKSRGINITTLPSPFPPMKYKSVSPDSHSYFSEDIDLNYSNYSELYSNNLLQPTDNLYQDEDISNYNLNSIDNDNNNNNIDNLLIESSFEENNIEDPSPS
ncbi:hypothetical protein PPL_05127 [Heterostelium album PN500]|uniref:Uncharacterized protein n=1 Tax=Heterostelium pallidum (strain ATCC 26659 / Pp 5 / PN500) TaxID=670386 RepID=D3B9I3_HETP5|nr:hypothetical protein PPL_05127 [Heterostelium album PN500]EFA81895.1 hypothetical protein PPL_05127 [Heterostelium album PN500]|eukprot:XP_020434012.1 hypothetical protein PPL_05127 [Heterostelium album PN500]